MEGIENVATNDLHLLKHESNNIILAAKEVNLRKSNGLQQKKRMPLENLSTNTSFGPLQDITKV